MPIAHAMFIHGHSIRVEYPDLMDDTVRKGYYARLKGCEGAENWFHLAIPTPLSVTGSNLGIEPIGGSKLRIDSVILRFRTSGATVTAIHVYDGEKKIVSKNGLSLAYSDWTNERIEVPYDKRIFQWGLGLSFMGKFGSENPRRIDVSSAGVDFLAS